MISWIIKKDRKYWDEIQPKWTSLKHATLYESKKEAQDYIQESGKMGFFTHHTTTLSNFHKSIKRMEARQEKKWIGAKPVRIEIKLGVEDERPN